VTTLRVLLSAPPAPARADEWALFDASGVLVRSGRDPPSGWPAADRTEYVVGAERIRIATTILPPLAAQRVAAAAAFALEDQFATPAGAQHLAAAPQAPDGLVRVVVVDRALLQSLCAGGAGAPARVIAEPELAPVTAGWRWCVAATGSGFVRFADGFALPVGPVGPDHSLPAELAVALAHARRAGTVPSRIEVDAGFDATALAQWQAETAIPFTAGRPWRWAEASAADFAAATELRLHADAAVAPEAPARYGRLFVPALWIAAAALGVHALATIGEWTWLEVETWRQARAWSALADAAGVSSADATTPAAARASLARRYADLQHVKGLTAPADALPLLARAAPVLARLPAGALKSATFADGHWTLDVQNLDAATLGELDARWKLAGLVPLTASTAAGQRVRIGMSQ
jgi:hypothetical protein